MRWKQRWIWVWLASSSAPPPTTMQSFSARCANNFPVRSSSASTRATAKSPSKAGRRRRRWTPSNWPNAAKQDGAARIIYTDISRDGTREGVNVEETLKIARAVNIPIIASGGVATLEDIRNLLPLEKEGVEAVILGRALYAGSSQPQGCRAGRQVAEPMSPLVHIWLPDEVAHRSV